MATQNKTVFEGTFRQAMAEFQRKNPAHALSRLDAEAARLGVDTSAPPRHQCETCCDLGVISFAVPVDDPRFGKFFPCPNLTCPTRNANLQLKYQSLLEKSHIPTKYAHYTFDTWEDAARHRPIDENWFVPFIRDWVTCPGHWLTMPGKWLGGGPDVARNSLVFSGDYGSGKTGLMIAAGHALIAQGEQSLYMRAMDYIDVKYKTYNYESSEEDREAVRLVQTAPVLLLDDFNIQNATDNRQDVMEDLIRYRHGHELPTIITCNYNIEQLTKLWGKRSVEALLEACHWIPIGGQPLRDVRQLGGAK